MITAAAAMMFIASFIPVSGISAAMHEMMETNRMVQRAFSIMLIGTSFGLMKRKRVSWLITAVVCTVNLIRSFSMLWQPEAVVFMILNVPVLAVLIVCRKDFCCPPGKRTAVQAAVFLLFSMVGIVVNAGISYHDLKAAVSSGEQLHFTDSLLYAVETVFGVNTSSLYPSSRNVTRFETAMVWFSWICIFASLSYAARPWIKKQIRTGNDFQHVRTLVNLYGQNPCSYLALEEDKTWYFGEKADGVIPYGVVRDTIVINGDPICADDDFPVLLNEFKDFCLRSAHNLFFLSITDHFLEEYKKQGFGIVKCGEEARFRLKDYGISGKKGAKMRMNINHASNAGVTVHEYEINRKKDRELEAEFNRITKEWISKKKSSLLSFTLGGVGFDNPMDKRYFYALNGAGRMCAFIVFVPFDAMKGYMADVTRHGDEAPGGVLEKIMYEALMKFKEEGIQYASLGVAPLAGLESGEERGGAVQRLLEFVYHHLNDCYGFQDLYRAKEKYSPTEWLPEYYAYLPKIPTPNMFYAVVRIQNPKGIMDYVRSFLKGRIQRKKTEDGR